MNIRYLVLSAVAVLLGIILVFLPEKKHKPETTPEELLLSVIDESRYISTDEVAHKIIEGDPQLILIDVRSVAEFDSFSLSGAINIPLDSILNPDHEMLLNQEDGFVVFYSNGSIYASQAWTICKRLAYNNIYIMKGGLNNWVETILRPVSPPSTAPEEAFALYQKRKAASQFFGGGQASVPVSADSPKPAPVVSGKKKKGGAQGGC
jgi:sulfur-carrier protein adenylyltransferase/sulfurtransferase